MASYRPIVLPVVPCVRGCVLDALRLAGATVYLLPLAAGQSARVAVEVRATWPTDTTGLTPMPAPVPAGWDALVAPS